MQNNQNLNNQWLLQHPSPPLPNIACFIMTSEMMQWLNKEKKKKKTVVGRMLDCCRCSHAVLGDGTSDLTDTAKCQVKFLLVHVQTGGDADHSTTCSSLRHISELHSWQKNQHTDPHQTPSPPPPIPFFWSSTDPAQNILISQVRPSQWCSQQMTKVQIRVDVNHQSRPRVLGGGGGWCLM